MQDNTARQVLEKVRGTYISYVFYLVLSLLITTLGAFASSYMAVLHTKGLYIGCVLGSVVLIAMFCLSRGFLKRVAFTLFTFGEGFLLGLALSGISSSMLYSGLLATTLIVSAFSILGLYCRDLSFMGSALLGVLLLLVGLTLLSFFIHMPFLSYIGLAVFSLYVMYDINQFKLDVRSGLCTSDDVLDHVMQMYLDIINILVNVIKIISDSDN